MSKIGVILTAAVIAVSVGVAYQANAQVNTLEKIKSTGAITLGYREASIPFSYLGADQKPVGMSIDLCKAVVEKVKAELKRPDLKVEMTAVNASNRIPLIQNGTVDLECGSTTNTAERQKQVAFSVATFVSQPTWLTTVASKVTSSDDLKGKTVVITQGSLNLALGEKVLKEKGLNATIIQGKDQAESLLLLRTGRAVAWFEDNILQAGLVANAPDPKAFKFLPDAYGGYFYYGLMMPKDDAAFKAVVDGVIKEKMASGEFSKLYNAWFTKPIPPSGQNLELPISSALAARIKSPSDSLTP